jgi:hypothetical protein
VLEGLSASFFLALNHLLVLLQEGAIVFDPPLPKRKQQAIKALGFGRLNKVA